MINRKNSWKMVLATGLFLSFGTLGISLLLSAYAYSGVDNGALFGSYFSKPEIILLNWLPVILLYFLFSAFTGRTQVGFVASYLVCIGLSLSNYFKISLRADPLLAEDVLNVFEARNIVQNYSLEFDAVVAIAIVSLFLGWLLAGHAKKKIERICNRVFVAILCVAIGITLQFTVYMNDDISKKVVNNKYIEGGHPVETYLSKGCIFSFLNSVKDAYHKPPEDYDEENAKNLYGSYVDESIPSEKKVSIVAIMLEAFCDLTDFPAFANQENVVKVYEPWHELEQRSVSGNLITDIFAGNTVQTERAFLTGDNELVNYRRKAESYAWYFKEQGYSTFGYHPYYDWFYNRRNVNAYLGLEEFDFFYEMYGVRTEEQTGIWTWDSDWRLSECLLARANEKLKEGPFFSFSVSMQNHGPYETAYDRGKTYIISEDTGFSQETCSIFNNYLSGVEDTINVYYDLMEELSRKNEPIVLCLFGDHKPWAGNGNSAYQEVGISFDFSTLEGIYNYYSTPYLIWANDAAKTVLNKDFVGIGKDISPCFLMTELFDQCGWSGSAFMQISREIRDVSPVIHTSGFFICDGELSAELPEDKKDQYNQYAQVQFYRRNRKLE